MTYYEEYCKVRHEEFEKKNSKKYRWDIDDSHTGLNKLHKIHYCSSYRSDSFYNKLLSVMSKTKKIIFYDLDRSILFVVEKNHYIYDYEKSKKYAKWIQNTLIRNIEEKGKLV